MSDEPDHANEDWWMLPVDSRCALELKVPLLPPLAGPAFVMGGEREGLLVKIGGTKYGGLKGYVISYPSRTNGYEMNDRFTFLS